MSVNLYSPLWKESFKYLGWILLFVFLWFRGCSNAQIPNVATKVIVPEVKGDFEPKKPAHHVVDVNNMVTSQKSKTIYKENPINQKLIAENEKLKADFAKASGVDKPLLFDKAIKLNKFSTKFEDDNLILNIDGIVQGEVKEITPNYTIKEKKIEIPVKQKETVFRLLGGVELGNNTLLNDFKAKGTIMFQNKKGNIISSSFDTNQTIWVGYHISIFDVKK